MGPAGVQLGADWEARHGKNGRWARIPELKEAEIYDDDGYDEKTLLEAIEVGARSNLAQG